MEREYSAVPKSVFSTDIDTVATAFLKRPDLPKTQQRNASYAHAILTAAEALVISPRVSFKVDGENVVLSILTRMFGANGVMELMESDAVEFVLWRPVTVQPVGDNPPGLSPVAAGNKSNPEHCDPEVSAFKGLNWYPGLDRTIRREIARKASEHTVVTPEQVPHQAAAAVLQAYRDGVLRDRGLDPAVPDYAQTPENRTMLMTLAQSLTESSILLEHEWDLYEAGSTWGDMIKVSSEVRSGERVVGDA